jgi:hypothetical protein
MLLLTLIARQNLVTSGLVDGGAAVNVLPYALGSQLGFDWDQETRAIALSANLAAVEARVVVLSAVIGHFPPVRLAFAWARTDAIPVILGQVNFFLEFDICFFRSRGVFEVRPNHPWHSTAALAEASAATSNSSSGGSRRGAGKPPPRQPVTAPPAAGKCAAAPGE